MGPLLFARISSATATGARGVEPLTPEQERVASAPPSARLIVLAGPGTGKTHTLIARVRRLLKEHDSRPLVLSFTRAVIRELRTRLREDAPSGTGYVVPATFDSLATRLLSGVPELVGYRDWEVAGYDGRIDAAVAALREKEHAARWVTHRFDHLVVDEIQDLVGRRAHLVLELMQLLPTFTVFGDPSQGIYGWQDDAQAMSADAFLAAVHGRFGATIEEHTLTQNHRARTPQSKIALAEREGLKTPAGAAASLRRLDDLVRDAQQLGSCETAVGLLSMMGSRTAVLCRTNAEALLMSEKLHAAGVDHALRRAAVDRAVAPWVAEIFRGRKGALSEPKFRELFGASSTAKALSEDAAWEVLTQVSDSDDCLSLEAIHRRTRQGSLPDELQATNSAGLTVSTIHRAKGLEFDKVVLVRSPDWKKESSDPAEEARVLFVALTRARDELFTIDPLDLNGWRTDDRVGRWYRCSWNKTWMTLGFELEGGDVHKHHPPGTWLFDADPAELQDYLRDKVRRGDMVELERIHVDSGGRPRAFYSVAHEGRRIGVTGEHFGDLLARRLRAKPNKEHRWPAALTGARVEGLDTVAGLENLGSAAGLGAAGLWLRPRIVGLASVRWQEESATTNGSS